MDLSTKPETRATRMRVPLACKVISWIAGLIFFFPGACILTVHRFIPGVPQYVSLGNRLFVAMLALPIALAGLIPVLYIESRRGD